MGTVVAQASMSLDGFIAKADNSIGRLFDWYEAGDVEQTTAMSGLTFRLTPASAAYWREWTADLGAIVCGRTLFDVVDNRWPDDRIERGTIRITATRNRANGRIVAPGTAQMV